jgi:3-oxosteroid 1-dehydrogenase
VTDASARVLREDGSPIPGLFAIGNTSASVMGTSYPGAGATIGPAMTFGLVAADTLAGISRCAEARAADWSRSRKSVCCRPGMR